MELIRWHFLPLRISAFSVELEVFRLLSNNPYNEKRDRRRGAAQFEGQSLRAKHSQLRSRPISLSQTGARGH